MTVLKFRNLEFRDAKDSIEALLLKNYSFSMKKSGLEKIGHFIVKKNSVEFKGISREKAEKKFSFLVSNSIKNLKNRFTGRKAVYIHKNSGIPLIGTLYFGIIDKGSGMLEIKPLTGCNLDCVFCSVGEGISSKREADYAVEDDYIAEELEKLLDFKRRMQKNLNMKVFINPHGEPLLYANIVQLIKKISRLRGIKAVSIITNGLLLAEKLIGSLKEAGLTQINLSVNSLNPKNSKRLSGLNSYDISRIKHLAEYASKRLKLVLAPVWIKGMNDNDIEELILFAKKLKCRIGIQKYIAHKTGKRPAKEISWEEFYKKTGEWEKKHNISLRYCGEISKTKELPMPFRRGDAVKAKVVCVGRKKNEVIAAAKGRCILVHNCRKPEGKEIRIKIKAARHNVFAGQEFT